MMSDKPSPLKSPVWMTAQETLVLKDALATVKYAGVHIQALGALPETDRLQSENVALLEQSRLSPRSSNP